MRPQGTVAGMLLRPTVALVTLAALAAAQDAKHPEGPVRGADESRMKFVEADAAFARASKEGRRVLVYQDWPT